MEKHIKTLRESESPADWLKVALYYLLGHGGLRISEALDLQVKDLALMARRVRVNQGKGGKDRIVLLTETAATALARYMETVPHAAEDLVLSWRGRPLSYGQAKRRLRSLGEEAGVQKLCAQRLRHTYATQLLNNGMSIDGLPAILNMARVQLVSAGTGANSSCLIMKSSKSSQPLKSK